MVCVWVFGWVSLCVSVCMRTGELCKWVEAGAAPVGASISHCPFCGFQQSNHRDLSLVKVLPSQPLWRQNAPWAGFWCCCICLEPLRSWVVPISFLRVPGNSADLVSPWQPGSRWGTVAKEGVVTVYTLVLESQMTTELTEPEFHGFSTLIRLGSCTL